MKPTKIADGVYDVGVIDWNIRDFHGYSTDRGTSYNAYLVVDEKVALIDTVKAPFTDQLLGNISQIIDPKKIDDEIKSVEVALAAAKGYGADAILLVPCRLKGVPMPEPWEYGL